MKYIRTNNRIYKIKDHEHNGFELVWRCEVKNKPGLYYEVKEHEVVHYGDTIEELCDEFVLNNKILPTIYMCGKRQYPSNVLCKGEKIYGAIWTDKGLIYVAKMNEKGELELL